MLCSRASFRLSVRRVVSTVIIVGSAIFYFLLRPIWAHSLCVRNQSRDQLQYIFFRAYVLEGIIVHTLGKVDGIEDFYTVFVAF